MWWPRIGLRPGTQEWWYRNSSMSDDLEFKLKNFTIRDQDMWRSGIQGCKYHEPWILEFGNAYISIMHILVADILKLYWRNRISTLLMKSVTGISNRYIYIHKYSMNTFDLPYPQTRGVRCIWRGVLLHETVCTLRHHRLDTPTGYLKNTCNKCSDRSMEM